MKYAIYRPSFLTWFVTMCELNRRYNLLQAKSLPEGLNKPLMHALTSTVGFRQRAAFSDIRVCHPNADSHRDLSPKQIYRIHENEKKRKYNSRVTEIEQGTFTPPVFTTTGGTADECLRYHSRLAELLSAKKQESYATTISWVRAKVSFAILQSALLCLRGSRTPRRRNLDVKDRDLEIEKGQAGLP